MSNAVHGRLCSVYFNQFDLSNYLNKFDAQRNAPELDQTTFLDTAKTFIAGLQDGSISLEGFFSHDETDLDTAEDNFKLALTASANGVLTVAPEGGAVFGKRALVCDAIENKHAISATTQTLIQSNAAFRGEISHGVMLAAKAARTATGNGTSVDNGASSANGGVAHQHVFSKSGTSPTLDTKIQHSVDDSTFADLITFTQATTVGSERKTVTGTVNRYLRESRTISGSATPTFTNAVAFARL